MIAKVSDTKSLQASNAWAVPKGFTLSWGILYPAGNKSKVWNAYSTWIFDSILLPIVSLNMLFV